ncbi:MAG: hypothetical protein R2939_10365 [Kofleriaceae bacterium]
MRPHGISSWRAGLAAAALAATAGACKADDPALPDARELTPVPLETVLDEAPAAVTNQAAPTLAFHATRDATFACTIDDGAAVPCTSPWSPGALAEGDHTFAVAATALDDGEVDPTPATAAWRLDVTPPTITLVSSPGALDNTVMPTFVFSASEPGVTFQCSLDGGAPMPCDSPWTIGPLADGVHTVTIVAVDAAGNPVAEPLEITWTVDTSTPDTVLDGAPAALVADADATFAFSSPTAGVGATFACSLDGAAPSACTSPTTYPGLADGAHTFTVAVTNAAGTADPSPASHVWTIDTVAPVVTFTQAPGPRTANPVGGFRFTVDDASATTACALDLAAPTACAGLVTTGALALGDHAFVVTATDPAGNVGQASHAFTHAVEIWDELVRPRLWPHAEGAQVYDAARGETVHFGGYGFNGFHLSELFTWDGAQWSFHAPAVTPGPRKSPGLAYDAARAQVVLFGGQTTTNAYLGDTWTWDGTTWTEHVVAGPSARAFVGMTYDEVRQRVVLFGGYDGANLGDTWTWDGTAWAQQVVAGPTARRMVMMTFDAGRGEAILFGGANTTNRGDTWAWDGATWTQRATTGPTARSSGAMTYDPARSRVVLFGGFVSVIGYVDDTWSWDGTAWTDDAPPTSPQARTGASLSFDPVLGAPLLSGGRGSSTIYGGSWALIGGTWVEQLAPGPGATPATQAIAYDELRDEIVLVLNRAVDQPLVTWTWDGATWIEHTPVTSPPVNSGPALGYDPVNQRVVLFGGLETSTYSAAFWWWDGATWTDHALAAAPPARRWTTLVTDRARDQIVMFGGQGESGNLNDTWTWDGTSWSEHVVTPRPSARTFTSAGFDELRGELVLFGGDLLTDTWTWNGVAWTQRTPTTVPPSWSPAAFYDAASQRMTMLGDVVYTWDGVDWIAAPQPPAAYQGGRAAVYHRTAGRALVFGSAFFDNVGTGRWWLGPPPP